MVSQTQNLVKVPCDKNPDLSQIPSVMIPAVSPLRGGDVAVNVCNVNQLGLPNPLYSVLVPISVFMALSTVFHSLNSPDNSPLSHSVVPIFILPHWSFQLYISLIKSPSALI